MDKDTIKILIGGDICPVNRAQASFMAGDALAVFTDLTAEFRQADLSIVNLECPLIETPTPVRKVGPVLGATAGCIRGISNAGIDVVGLANNHILDHGPAGLRTTLGVCRRYGVDTVGAGENLPEAGRMLIRDVKGYRIAVLAMAEHEFSLASPRTPGANPVDVISFIRKLRANSGSFDFLIVLLHGGNEFYPYPSPRLSRLCRFLVEEGAGLVVCQHSHCPGCLEAHQDGHIVYGQGNLVFDRHPYRHEFWYEGFLIEVSLDGASNSCVRIVPYRQFDSVASVRKLARESADDFRRELEQRSIDIQREGFLQRQWQDFCENRTDEYLGHICGYGRLLGRLNTHLHIARRFSPSRRMLLRKSVIQCESHRDVLETVLDKSLTTVYGISSE